MVALLISILVNFSTFSTGTNTDTKQAPTTSTTVNAHGGTSTWTNGGVD